MGKYIDIHCHLDMDKFDSDLDEVIKRAKEKEVLIIQSGINPEANKKSLEMRRQYGVFCSFGLYPIDSLVSEFGDLKDDYDREMKPFSVDEGLEWIGEHKDECLAVGEIGLDFKVIECSDEIREAQIKNFEKMLKFAKKIGKPVIIHSRGAELKATEVLEGMGWQFSIGDGSSGSKVVMHCFSGKKGLIKRGVENGWFFSIPPIITRLQHFETVVRLVPLKQLLTETDSPFLSPVRRERNEPINVKVTIKEIARIKEVSEEEVREQIMKNAKGLFGF